MGCTDLRSRLASWRDWKLKKGLRLRFICDHLERHVDRYSKIWDGKAPSKEEAEIPGRDFNAYVRMLRVQGAWAGSLECLATANQYGRAQATEHTGTAWGTPRAHMEPSMLYTASTTMLVSSTTKTCTPPRSVTVWVCYHPAASLS